MERNPMSLDSLGMTLDYRDLLLLRASRSDEQAWLVIEAGDTQCEIWMGRVHVEALHKQLPDVLAGLDKWAVEDAGCEKADMARQQAADAAAQALDLALTAEQAGTHAVAGSPRTAAEEATTAATAVDALVRAYEDATAAADHATNKLLYAMSQAHAALSRHRDQSSAK
jgi:hypothetical protein